MDTTINNLLQNSVVSPSETPDRPPNQQQPERQQTPVLSVGCVLTIGHGQFRVKSFGRRFIMLESLPGTHIHLK